MRADAKSYLVAIAGETRSFVPRGKLFDVKDEGDKSPVVVGDRVRVSLDGDPPGVEEVLPRTNYLPRVASSHDPRQQILFANVDQLFLVSSVAKPTFSSNRADRILTTCRYHEIPACLILNKIDLDKDDQAREIARTYEEAGVEVLFSCATDGRGLEPLAARMRPRPRPSTAARARASRPCSTPSSPASRSRPARSASTGTRGSTRPRTRRCTASRPTTPGSSTRRASASSA
jgi:putative ribosome biogenesis GTPase RsgA